MSLPPMLRGRTFRDVRTNKLVKVTEDTVAILKRPLYGLVDAPAEWQQMITQQLIKVGYRPLTTDPNVFVIAEWPDPKAINLEEV